MSIFDRIFKGSEKRTTNNVKYEDLAAFLGGGATASGVTVNKETALTFSGYSSALKILSEDIAKLSKSVFKKTDEGKEIDRKHPAYKLIHSEPNAMMTAFVYHETMMMNVLGSGNAYAWIVRDRRANPIELVPLPSSNVEPVVVDNEVFYKVDLQGFSTTPVPSEDMIHIGGFSYDGIKGKGLLQYGKEFIGAGLAQQEFGNRLFSNGANMSGVLEHPGKLNADTAERLRKAWASNLEHLKKAHKTAVLEEGMKYTRIAISPEEAQMIDSKQFSIRDMARATRIPPHMMADLADATFSNVEQMSTEYVQNALLPWIKKQEQEYDRKLLKESEKKNGTHSIKFNVDSMLRGDISTRGDFYVKMLQNGVMSPNEVRLLENLNKRDGGDEYMTPLNMTNNQDNGEEDN